MNFSSHVAHMVLIQAGHSGLYLSSPAVVCCKLGSFSDTQNIHPIHLLKTNVS